MAEPNPKWQAGVKERYDAFASAYVLNACNGAMAARIAGYSPKRDFQTANRLVSISYIKQRIAEIREDLEQKVKETACKWLCRVKDTEDRAREAEDYTAEARQQEIIAKHLGYYALDNAQKATDARTFNLTQLTAIIEADKARVKEIDSIEEGIAE